MKPLEEARRELETIALQRRSDDGVFAELATLLGVTPMELMESHLKACKRALTAWARLERPQDLGGMLDDVAQTLIAQAARHVDSAIVCVRLAKSEAPTDGESVEASGPGPQKTSPTGIVARSRREGT